MQEIPLQFITKEEADKMFKHPIEKSEMIDNGINTYEVIGKIGDPNPTEINEINRFTGEKKLIFKRI